MSRRANLPGAAELFRVTREEPAAAPAPAEAVPPAPVPLRPAGSPPAGEPAPDRSDAGGPASPASRRRQPSRRQRHDEKITVYISAEELDDLEHARLVLRREHGVRVDRGRIVREALALVLADLEAAGAESDLVRRCRAQ